MTSKITDILSNVPWYDYIDYLLSPGALLCFIGIAVGTLVIKLINDPFREVPGPLIARFNDFYYKYHFLNKDMFIDLTKLHRKHGHVVRIGPKMLSFNSGKAFREIYGNKDFLKTPAYHGLDIEGPNILSVREPHTHGTLRKILSPCFGNSYLQSIEDVIQDSGMVPLMNRYKEDASNGEAVVDIYKTIHYSVADIIGEVIFGHRFGMVTSNEDHEFLQWLHVIQRMLSLQGQAPFLKWLQPILFPTGRIAFAKAMEFCRERVVSRQGSSEDRKDILNLLITASDSATGEKINFNSIEAEAFLFFVAGIDTTSHTLLYLFMNILKQPKIYQRLTEELVGFFPDKEQKIESKSINRINLPYLWAVVQETLRCFPPGANGLPRWCSQDTTIDGVFVPAYTAVIVPIYSLHRNETIFGEEPDKFNPDRWLKGDTSEMMKYWVPFSYGIRSCIARNLAMMEIYLTVAYLIRQFELRLADPNIPIDLVQVGFNTIVNTHSVKVHIKKRTD